MTAGRGIRAAGLAIVIAVIAAVVAIVVTSGGSQRHVTADFASTTSLYPGADVKVLGVTVGKVTSVKVSGDQVQVGMSYGASHALPTDVHAVIVPPSIVGDRYVELTPPYTGGPKLADHATITQEHTQIPVEIDQIYQSINQLSSALGPNGANSKGALSDLLHALALNLGGNGTALHSTVTSLSAAIATLSNSRGHIAGSVTHLNALSQTFSRDDPQVRTLAQLLATVSTELNQQDSDLASATTSLDSAFHQVAQFVHHNRSLLTSNLSNLTTVAHTIAANKRSVAAALDLAPLGLTDLWDTYIPENWNIDHPTGLNINGMETDTTARSNLFEDLGTQIGSTLGAFCAELPSKQAKQLKPLCTALTQAGGNLGSLLTGVLTSQPGVTSNRSLSALLLGGSS